MKQPVIAAIFDFDGTLCTGHLFKGVLKHHTQYKVKRLPVTMYFVSHMVLWLLSKIKVVSEEYNKVKWGADLAGLFKGFTSEQGRKIFEWVFHQYLLSLMRADVLELLKQHKEQGNIIILLSGTFNDFLSVAAAHLGADYFVGTEMEISHGLYSGRIVKPLCFGVNKAALLSKFIEKHHLNVDLVQSYAYADGISDVPVLELVGNPVVTYPDEQLLSLAEKKHWQILPYP